ncbi:hypothetical protein HDIA_0713 [Hartmannibacter diazotrophicus]|uniref:Helicase C-terminal domain-containing protein n=2 Tax=Hartmannibacter diazotrophicus TaxID=1482074 RepID=A0A2C9D1Z5_9HYPH|nr:hypothetical protein HDIA_0713 [Hartmannibacter diazotrophicus]
MPGILIFAPSQEVAREISATLGAYHPQTGADIREMLKTLEEGGSAVAYMGAFVTGFNIPEGVRVLFDSQCDMLSAEGAQAKARFDKLSSRLHRTHILS